MCSFVHIELIIVNIRFFETGMSHKDDVLESLEAMRECLKETLRETAEIREIAIEEEALIAPREDEQDLQ